MTAATRPPVPAPPRLHAPPTQTRPWPTPSAVLAGGVFVSLLLFAVALTGLVLDQRTITGAPAWLKPAKFGLSAALYLATLRWMIGRLPNHPRSTAVISNLAVVVLLAELVWISLQVIRGTTSHFNVSSTFDAAAYYTMGAFISVLVFTTIAVGVRALRTQDGDAGLAAGIRWGIGICVLGMLEAVLIVTNNGWSDSGGHTVGAPDGGPGLPLTQWSTLHGDLRVAHFAGLHGLQVLPLLAWGLARTGLDERVRARLVAVAGTAYVGLVALLAWQALRGQALLRPDHTILEALAGLLMVTAAGLALVLRKRTATRPPGSVT